jgi:DUF1365 family protein
MKSCMYSAKTYHLRLFPKKHEFNFYYPIFLIDLDELDSLNKKMHLFSNEKFNLFSFKMSDHRLDRSNNIKSNIQKYAKSVGITEDCDKIYLLTQLRVLGYYFNPVSYYFLFANNVQTAVIAEVMNTFYEIKYYPVVNSNKEQTFEGTFDKHFYVSPYTPVDGKIKFVVGDIRKKLDIHVYTNHNNQNAVYASLKGKEISLTDLNLVFAFFKLPISTLFVFLSIHFHALILYLKKIPFYKKSEKLNLQKDFVQWKK